jgi:caffeoyl-CoA O-methyltransferase
MSNRTLSITDSLADYILANSLRESDLLKKLREETAYDAMARMQIAPEQGQFMSLLVKLINAKNAIEVGTFTGYSSLCIAAALPNDGKLVACDVSEKWTAIAKHYWEMAGVAHKIELHLQPATTTLQTLINNQQHNHFDFAFIDADKPNYDNYYELCLQLVRPNGLIVIDNVLWGGDVADEAINDADTCAIRALNKKLLGDDRIELSLLPMADGLTLVLKK